MDLNAAIEAVYAAFAHERPDGLRHHSPFVDVKPHEFAALLQPLRTISRTALARYARKAMTTWGDTATFRYYLPRLLEQADDLGILADKLAYGAWRTWAPAQVESVENVVLVYARRRIRDGGDWTDPVDALWRLGIPISPLFDLFITTPNDWSTAIDLVHTYLLSTPYPAPSNDWCAALQRWLLSDAVHALLWRSLGHIADPAMRRARDEAIDLVTLLRSH